MSKVRIMIADDHLVFRLGLRTLLGTEGEFTVVAEAPSGSETVTRYREHRPDVTLLDLRMPEGGGLRALREIRSFAPEARLLLLSSYGVEEDVYQSMRAGAAGYLLKDVDRDELVAAIRHVHAGKLWVTGNIAAMLAERAPRPDLTTREIDVLRLLARGLICREIGKVLAISESTVRHHTIHLFAKLEVTDRIEAASFALQRGIIQLDELAPDAAGSRPRSALGSLSGALPGAVLPVCAPPRKELTST